MVGPTPELVAEIKKKYEQLTTGNYYDLLEVDRKASAEVIRNSYRQLAKKYHQDRYVKTELGDLAEMLQSIFAALSKAAAVLSNSENRRSYDDELAADAQGAAGAEVMNIFVSEDAFRSGKNLLARGNFAAAHKKFAEACELNSNEKEFLVHRTYTSFMMLEHDKQGKPVDQTRAASLIQSVKSMLAEFPNYDVIHQFLGSMYKNIGNEELAISHFNKALEANPKNVDAAREIRLHRTRTKRTESKGLLDRLKSLFKK